jgi:hypothetical protein
MCDVEKMFHHFKVEKEDQEYIRFLWWEDGNIDSNPSDYRMKVHLFGAVSSPGCANYGLKQIAKDNSAIGTEAVDFIKRNFYALFILQGLNDSGIEVDTGVDEKVDVILFESHSFYIPKSLEPDVHNLSEMNILSVRNLLLNAAFELLGIH